MAATISIDSNPSTFGVGDRVQVSIIVDTRTRLNTFAGAFVYPTDLFDAISVSDGDSIASLWLVHPEIGVGNIPFAGFSIEGFLGRGELLSVVLRAKKEGRARFSIVDPQLLRADGAGSTEHVIASALTVAVNATSSGGYVVSSDRVPPEPFQPQLIAAKDSPDGLAHLVFTTTDGGSGIDRYEVAEVEPGQSKVWQKAESPYLIHDQNLVSDIFVKAIDRAGNERVAEFPHKNTRSVYEILVISGMLVVLIALCVLSAWLARRFRY